MFTGIIRHMGEVTSNETGKKASLLTITSPLAQEVREGDSVAVGGACLTVLKADQNTVRFRLMEETLQRANLGSLAVGSKVNLERPVKAGENFDGHFVMGHVDGVAEITDIRGASDKVFTLQPFDFAQGKPRIDLMPYLIEKGSVTLDGVSLTVVTVSDDAFTVSLMPYTLQHTTLGGAQVGDKVNIEVDMIGKYVKRFLDHGNSRTG